MPSTKRDWNRIEKQRQYLLDRGARLNFLSAEYSQSHEDELTKISDELDYLTFLQDRLVIGMPLAEAQEDWMLVNPHMAPKDS